MQKTFSALLFFGLICLMFNGAEVKAIESDLTMAKKWVGDFDGMAERHLIRALVPPQ